MNKTIKVIHIFGSLNVGGAESRIMDVYRMIDRKKLLFDFVTLDVSDKQYFEKEILTLGGNIYKISSPRITGFYKHFLQLVRIFKRNNTNGNLIVHAHTLHHSGIVLLAARLSGVKIRIAHARSTKTMHQGIFSIIIVSLGRLLIKLNATHRLAISEDAAYFLFGKNSIKNGEAIILPNAIDLTKYQNIKIDEINKLKSKYKIDQGKKIIGHVGRFEKMKNHNFLIDVFNQYCKKWPDTLLVLIGDGTLFDKITRKIDDTGITDKVLLLGVRNDVPKWMKTFDVLVMPSIFEGLCGAAIEAQAAGTPSLLSESIPPSADIGLGLTTFISLNETMEKWILSIEKSLSIQKKSEIDIINQFEERKLTLANEIVMLYKIYGI